VMIIFGFFGVYLGRSKTVHLLMANQLIIVMVL